MKVTFLVELNLDDISTLADVAADIEDDLSGKFEVTSVKPWARPSVNPLSVLPTLTEQPTQNQGNQNVI